MVLQPSLGSSHTSASGIFSIAMHSHRRPRRANWSLRKRERPPQQSMTNVAWSDGAGSVSGPGDLAKNPENPCVQEPQSFLWNHLRNDGGLGAWQSAGTLSALWVHILFPNNFSFQDLITKVCPVLCQCDAC